jgi:hypothetical protein
MVAMCSSMFCSCSYSQRLSVLQPLLKHTLKSTSHLGGALKCRLGGSLRSGFGDESGVDVHVDVAVHVGDAAQLPRGGFDERYHRSGDKGVGNRRGGLHEVDPGGVDAARTDRSGVSTLKKNAET